MAETVIKVENVSKLYKLGYVGSGTFRDDVKYYFDKLRGKKSEAELIAETILKKDPALADALYRRLGILLKEAA